MSISTDFSIRTHEYVPSLDGVRGVSVLLILFFHGQLPGFGKAFIGVDIFFVLSGYLITKILVREYDRNKVISLVHFYQRRILRLFPALVLMSILFTAYCAVFLPDFPTRLWETAEALLYISNWSRAFSLGTSRYLGHTWSLSIEEQFYLLWPIVLIAILRLRRGYEIAFCMTLTFVVSAALWRLGLALQGTNAIRLYNGFDTRCDCVLIGCALALIAPRLTFLWPIGLGGILISLIYFRWNDPILLMGGYTGIAASAALVIAGATKSDTYLSHALSFPPLVAIGRISYGLYLYHFPIYAVIADKVTWNPYYLNTMGLGLTVVIAILSYLYIERPCLKIRNISSWSNGTRYLAYLGPICVAVGTVYIVYSLIR